MQIPTKFARLFGTLICTTTVALAPRVASAQAPFDVVHGFSSLSGQNNPIAAVIQAADGNFYGTTAYGGTVFRMTPGGTVSVLHVFAGGTDGSLPYAPLVQARDGNFYGTTVNGGGTSDLGTVFKMTPGGTVTVLHAFVGGTDGAYPHAALIQAADGNFYGTTSEGGAVWNSGTVFQMTPSGNVTVLHAFSGYDGAYPQSHLIQATDGNFYGTTTTGSYLGPLGTIFRMTPGGAFTTLHAFTFEAGLAYPHAALIQATDGNFYGTTELGGGGLGAVFRMTPNGTLTVVHAFAGTDGADPSYASLIQATDGNFYGTTESGGAAGAGTVFQMTPSGTITVLHAFAGGTDGGDPLASLIQAIDGNLYGTTPLQSCVFRLTTTGAFNIIAHALPGSADGFAPQASLIEGADGNLYGTTAEGGVNYAGTVFRLTPSGVTKTIHAFNGADGALPSTALLQGPDGNFYGTTARGGSSNGGTVFRMTPDGTVTVLHAFTGGADGAGPYASLVRGSDGNFYGTTRDGGPLNFGTVFRVTPTGAYTGLYQFAGGYDGGHPLAALVLGADGDFYGTTSITGAFNAGTAFRITAGGRLTILHAFSGTDGTGRDGAYPQAALLQGADGNFYGTTFGGGTFGVGTIYRMTPAGAVTILHAFTGPDGANPMASLIQGSDGNLYGTTSNGGGDQSAGTAFQSTLTGLVTVLHAFPRTCCVGYPIESSPHAALVQAGGHLYGTTSQRGGTVFRLRVEPDAPTSVRVATIADRQVQLRWLAVATATSYTVSRTLASGQESVLATGIAATSFVDTSAMRGHRYYYVVSATNAFGEGVASYEVAITPGRAIEGDFDGDGASDVTVFRPSTGAWYTIQSSTGAGTLTTWGVSGDIPVAGDYDGDGKTDLAVYRPSTGVWYIIQSSTGTGLAYTWGVSGDLPVPGDYDGDGKTDITVYRPSTGVWYVVPSSTGNGLAYAWGAAGDTPVAADYDGDGKTDIAFYRPSTGVWYIVPSSTGNGFAYTWGIAGDIPVTGDYDGDGKADIAVFRPSSGIWFIVSSRTGTGTCAPSGCWVPWAVSGDIPVAGDYDGDGKTDIAVYRPSAGVWHIVGSSTGNVFGYTWGVSGDIPILKRP